MSCALMYKSGLTFPNWEKAAINLLIHFRSLNIDKHHRRVGWGFFLLFFPIKNDLQHYFSCDFSGLLINTFRKIMQGYSTFMLSSLTILFGELYSKLFR